MLTVASFQLYDCGLIVAGESGKVESTGTTLSNLIVVAVLSRGVSTRPPPTVWIWDLWPTPTLCFRIGLGPPAEGQV